MTILPIMSVLFMHRCKYNGIWCDCHTSERLSSIKPGSVHHILHLKIPVPSQEYNSCCPFVWCVLSFEFAIWLRNSFEDLPRSSVFLWFCFFMVKHITWLTMYTPYFFITNIKKVTIINCVYYLVLWCFDNRWWCITESNNIIIQLEGKYWRRCAFTKMVKYTWHCLAII